MTSRLAWVFVGIVVCRVVQSAWSAVEAWR
jgi:hypothetical protein